jgi:hypothetical protein
MLVSDERQTSALEMLELLSKRVTGRATFGDARLTGLAFNADPSLLALVTVWQRRRREDARAAYPLTSRKILCIDLSIIYHPFVAFVV